MEKTVKSVWIAGAGYLGRPLAQELVNKRIEVIASSRGQQNESWWREWDLHAQSPLQYFQAASTWIILLPPSGSPTYVDDMRYLCDLAKTAQVQHVIYTSSTSVYGDEVRMCDEESQVLPQTESASKMVACEALWLDSGLPRVSVLRLGGLYDDERHPVSRLSGRVDIVGGLQPVNVVHRRHALHALLDVVETPKQSILNVVEKSHPSRAEFYTQEAVRLDLPVPVFNLDAAQSGKIVTSRYQHWSF